MKLRFSFPFRQSLICCLATICVYAGGAGVARSEGVYVFGAEDSLMVDCMEHDSIMNLDGAKLQFQGETQLKLNNVDKGDGRTYALLTGVSGLVDSSGASIANGASIADYFDASQRGSGFWSDAVLQLDNGTLQAVLHSENVKGAVSITTHQEGMVDYQYHEAVSFADVYQSSGQYVYGGAILATDSIKINYNGSVNFNGNTAICVNESYAYAAGGAIYSYYESDIEMNHNGSVIFRNNSAQAHTTPAASFGGAVCASGSVSFNDNGSVIFAGNSARVGGGIYGNIITINNNASVSFCDNISVESAGALYEEGFLSLSDNGSVNFSNNYTKYDGGAIFACYQTTVELNNNGSLIFSGNAASSSFDDYAYAAGGAIYLVPGSNLFVCDNGSVVFSGNSVSSYYDACGGAIVATNALLSIQNNDSVLFEKNVENTNGVYRLRSIYAGYDDSAESPFVTFSASAGKEIEFRDSVFIGAGAVVALNADYENSMQQGDIIFTGAYAEAHLNEILAEKEGGRSATNEEILASRTTVVDTVTNLYGGRLRVEEGAVYQGQGIIVHKNSDATVRVNNAELNHAGATLEFNSGTTLEVAGESTIRGTVSMLAGSVFNLEKSAVLNLYSTSESDFGSLEINGTIQLEGGAVLNASLTLAEESILDMSFPGAGVVAVNGVLTFGGAVTLGDNLIDILCQAGGKGEDVALFTGVEGFVFAGQLVTDDYWQVSMTEAFSNGAGFRDFCLSYARNTGSLTVRYVPEPATATLGMLALSLLAGRRRRK